jgi:hypothetical protein
VIRTLLIITAFVTLGAAAASAASTTTITIRHQVRGCHAWSFANGPYKASLKISVDRDTSLIFVDNDMMPHRLLKVAGPKLRMFTPNMNHMGAAATVSFMRAGVYRFVTKAGEDYMKGMKTIGEDNVLRLTVTVS